MKLLEDLKVKNDLLIYGNRLEFLEVVNLSFYTRVTLYIKQAGGTIERFDKATRTNMTLISHEEAMIQFTYNSRSPPFSRRTVEVSSEKYGTIWWATLDE